jgi:hypothetical protein
VVGGKGALAPQHAGRRQCHGDDPAGPPARAQHLSRKIAALVGVARFNHDSGKLRGRHAIWGGRAQVRAVLYMCALVGARRHPVLREFYARFLAWAAYIALALVVCQSTNGCGRRKKVRLHAQPRRRDRGSLSRLK